LLKILSFSITAHYVDENFVRHNFPLSVTHFELEEQKNAFNIVEKLVEMLTELGFNSEQVFCMVRDGESGMASAGKHFESR
jgi:hypothetical protein